jgi:hypothetical protein
MANPRILLATVALVGPILHAGDQKPPLKTPSGWAEISSGVFKLEHPEQARKQAAAILAGGHQPWRLVPANLAAECLQAFGIEGPQNLIEFGAMLHPIQANSIFQLQRPGLIYTVHIDNQSNAPVATKLVVSKQ